MNHINKIMCKDICSIIYGYLTINNNCIILILKILNI